MSHIGLKTRLILFLLLTASTPFVVAKDKKPEEAAAIIERAAKQSAIETPGAAPFVLRSHVRSWTRTGEKTEGEYSLFWVARDRSRTEATATGYSEINVYGKGSRWKLRVGPYSPKGLSVLDTILRYLFELKLAEEEKVVRISRMSEKGIPSVCIDTKWQSGPKMERCFSAESGVPLRLQSPFYTFEYSDYAPFRDKQIPRSLHAVQSDGSVLEATIWEVSDQAFADSLFEPPAGAEELPVCQAEQGVKAPKALKAPDPEFPSNAQVGRVVLTVQVGTDGLAHSPVVVETGGQLLDQAAIAVMARWRFQPATCNGSPFPVELRIEVNFRR